MKTVRLGPRVALVVLAVLLVGCSGDDDVEPASPAPGTTEASPGATSPPSGGGASTVEVVLTEWAVEPGVAKVAPGTVTFKVSNNGWVPHELAVVRTDLAADALPVAGDTVDEKQVDVIGRVDQFVGFETREITLTLEAGSYVLICNTLAHYQLGVRAAFRVEQPLPVR